MDQQVHGASSIWQTIKRAFPKLAPSAVGPGAKASSDVRRQLDVQASSALGVEAAPSDPSAPPGSFSLRVPGASGNEDAPQPLPLRTFGYATGVEKKYRVEKELARGGNGIVALVTQLATGRSFAMKILPKYISDPNVSERKRAEHADAIAREVDVLRRLRGCLNVAALEEIFEDDTHVQIVMEHCSGGELHHVIGAVRYSERTVASFMRGVLRTLAQCHANKILHRDIKPGNFLLASNDVRAPLKAIDFGLAVFFDDRQLPRSDVGLEGTPWYMAPEVLRSEVYPSSDLWSAGVMAHQLLTGRFPFDDRTSPHAPSISRVW
jgi:calcium-dependent protein kinase